MRSEHRARTFLRSGNFAVACCAAVLAAAPALAAEGPPPAVPDKSAEWCKANPERCRELQARRKEREAICKADPERCKAEAQTKRAERFSRADANKDGKITREEAEKGMPGVARRFDQVDTNKDGVISKEELDAAAKARAERKGKQNP